MNTVVLQGDSLTAAVATSVANELKGQLRKRTHFSYIDYAQIDNELLAELQQRYQFDINILPAGFDPADVMMLITDMDSTLIAIECIDEIADYINVKPQVAEITEAAMRGDIDFETSLRKRVSLLKGLDVSALEKVYFDRLTLNPGAEVMVRCLRKHGVKTALVSGGFTFFTERLQQRLGLNYTMANVLEVHNGKLTGDVVGDVFGAQSKADFLLAKCQELNIKPSQIVAMGDGANDLLMMKEAGLGIAYHAKPKVQQQASVALNHSGLDGVLGLLQLEYNKANLN
jgi:phosphoserine phosphatase